LKFNDISVSRLHCVLTLKSNKLHIVDKKSKFGTLFYISKPLQLSSSSDNLFLQCGKSVLDIKYHKPYTLFSIFNESSWCCRYKPLESELIINLEEDDNDNTKITEKEKECKININDSFKDRIINLDQIITSYDI